MAEEQLHLVELDESMRDEYLAYVAELRESGEGRVPWVLNQPADDFPALVRYFKDQARGVGLKEGWVPNTTYWLVNRDNRILGVANLRHELTPRLLHEGGHIGYGVRPSERRKGYATEMLALVLEKCRERGLERALITCDSDNIPSAKVIRNNGGGLENEVVAAETGKTKQRYWIEL